MLHKWLNVLNYDATLLVGKLHDWWTNKMCDILYYMLLLEWINIYLAVYYLLKSFLPSNVSEEQNRYFVKAVSHDVHEPQKLDDTIGYHSFVPTVDVNKSLRMHR